MNVLSKYFVVAIIASSFIFHAELSGKKLGTMKMLLVSIGITAQPDLMVTAWVAREGARDTLDKIKQAALASPASSSSTPTSPTPTDTKKNKDNEVLFVQKYRDQLVAPIDSFLAPFRGERIIVVPLLKESLGENSMLERLFNTDLKVSTKTFFEKEVQNLDALTIMSTEFVTFISDLEESLSALATKRYKSALETYQKKTNLSAPASSVKLSNQISR